MKKSGIIIGALTLTAAIFTGCSSAYFASAGYASDDLYALHDRAQIAREQQAKAEAEKAEAEARRAEWEARIAEAEAAAAQNKYYEYNSNPYEEVLADTYESAYARRLRGFESPTYRMPSSYYDLRYSNAFTYVSAYDPAFYNIIVMGDQVWVEPKYITSMFGTWGTVVYADPWYYGWNYPWGPTFSIGSWGWSFGWNAWYNPWYSPWYGPWGPWYSYWYRPVWGWGPGWIGHPGGGPNHHFRPTADSTTWACEADRLRADARSARATSRRAPRPITVMTATAAAAAGATAAARRPSTAAATARSTTTRSTAARRVRSAGARAAARWAEASADAMPEDVNNQLNGKRK